ncbi:MAG: YigZ family protein [Peptococcaceae bacterium]|nr:YigZ family protein [Peptococcaceae bacterium]
MTECNLSQESFLTVAGEGLKEQIIEKSRFIGLVRPVKTIDDVERHMQEVKKEFPNARHYVYAYRLYQNRLEKSSDDGEPQGTGGRPILDLLQHRQLWDVQIIVVRYFGGILLGTGGLTRAYGGTARLALEQAGITKLECYAVYRLEFSYAWFDQLKYVVQQKGWKLGEEAFAEKVSLEVYVPAAEVEEFESWLDDFTKKQVAWAKVKYIMR